jgi:hypothetical protein
MALSAGEDQIGSAKMQTSHRTEKFLVKTASSIDGRWRKVSNHWLVCDILAPRSCTAGLSNSRRLQQRSVFVRAHDDEDARRLRGIGRVGGAERAGRIVVIDFPEVVLVVDHDGAEVVLTMRIVLGRELAEKSEPKRSAMCWRRAVSRGHARVCGRFHGRRDSLCHSV